MDGQEQVPKLLDEVRRKMRLHHYSIHTERSYIDWIKRHVAFHRMSCREDLADGERKIEAFLSELAVKGKVSPSTQNQAMNALVFLYKRVLEQPLGGAIDAVRAERKVNVPVVLTREEVGRVIPLLGGAPQLIVKLLYGSGLRVLEAVRLRVKDVDFQMKQVSAFGQRGQRPRDDAVRLNGAVSGEPTPTGQGAARAGPGGRPWRGVPALCAGAQISAGGPRMGLAVFVSGAGYFERSLDRHSAASPRGSGRGEQGDQSRGAEGGTDEGGERAHLQAQLCNAPVTARD